MSTTAPVALHHPLGSRTVRRLGYGAMQLGAGPRRDDHAEATAR